ncbi:MAG: DUF817 domain-containing protein [Gallionellaceae bacterium]|jgi:uncharacterized membrane protein YoaT (DUF817 family)|nr:DUF817 domain-containing protein [Gallionellaceae bacterium]
MSAGKFWPLIAHFQSREARLGERMRRNRVSAFLYEFLRFGVKQAWACLFGGAMVALIVATHYAYPPDTALSRYDFLFLAALAIQCIMLILRLETLEEAKVILIYHVIGTAMEIFKTHVGSWIYPENAFFRIGGVPLFSGFMYASVGSYITRCWRLFDFRFTHHPPVWALLLLSTIIYVNFFSHHYTIDLRWLLFIASAILLGRTWVHYHIWHTHRRMPLLLGLFLVSLFIWFAENLGTWAHAWMYPHQAASWSMVSFSKLGSWFLLLIISYSLVAWVNKPERDSAG